MKNFIVSLSLALCFTSTTFATFQFKDPADGCFPSKASVFYSNFPSSQYSGQTLCNSDVTEINEYRNYYRSLYKKCEKRNQHQSWCKEYKTEWDYYQTLLH